MGMNMKWARARRDAAALVALALLAACGSDPTAPPPPDLVITTATLPSARVGVAYTEGIDAEGGEGDYGWEIVEGALPDGLTLTVEDPPSSDAIVSGTPERAQVTSFTVRVSGEGGQAATRTFGITVQPPPPELAVATIALPPPLEGAPYDVGLRAAGGDGSYAWRVVSGSLPAGLTLTDAGRVQGTPTQTGESTVTVEVESGGETARSTFVLRVVADVTGTYNLTPFPVVPIPTSLVPNVNAALARWDAVLTGDLPSGQIATNTFGSSSCGGFGQLVNGASLDDIIVMINIAEIDGPGKVLGRAGPCGLRSGSDLPFVGVLTLDSEDLEPLAGTEAATDLIVHEIGHILGFGSLWDHFGLVSGADTSSPRFTGPAAVEEYQALGGAGDVPLETEGGTGTALGHWSEAEFDRELMTGFAERPGTEQPLSRVSVASLADLGYAVDLSAADDYALPLLQFSTAEAATAEHEHLGYDIVGVGGVVTVELDRR